MSVSDTTLAGRAPAPELVGKELVLTRVFNAPRSLVFKVWTDPQHVREWWGPHQFTTPVCELEVRKGGRILMQMRGPDGSVFPMNGSYVDVVEPEKLVFLGSIPDDDGQPIFEVETTVLLEERDGKTQVTMKARVLSATAAAAPSIAGMDEGWNQSLDRLTGYLETQTNSSSETSDREIVITRVINAPRELVFKVWIEPEHVAAWWGPNGFTNTIQKMEFREGGTWEFIMHGPDGTDYKNRITYREIVRPERLVYDHGGEEGEDAFRASATFSEVGPRQTRVTLKLLLSSAQEKQRVVDFGAIEGGEQTLAKLDAYVSKL